MTRIGISPRQVWQVKNLRRAKKGLPPVTWKEFQARLKEIDRELAAEESNGD